VTSKRATRTPLSRSVKSLIENRSPWERSRTREVAPPRGRSINAVAEESMNDLQLRPVATVRSPLTELGAAPKQAHEGAPEAWLEFVADVHDALDGLRAGDDIIVLTWLDRADREVQRVHPRDDPATPMRGVFSTRSPARPNPIGLHELRVLEIDGLRVRVSALEAIDGTPVIDVKPQLKPV
jgi:tRNA-Thr(GGU) m(6)t(6)A37 methyltransferase TsaA